MGKRAALFLFFAVLLAAATVFAESWRASVNGIEAALKDAGAASAQGRQGEARAAVSRAYFDIFEAGGMEAAIGARISTARKTEIEAMFSGVRGAIGAGRPPGVLRERSAALLSALKGDALKLSAADAPGEGAGTYALFFNALIIILREGFEAILVIGALTAYLVKTGHARKTAAVYRGALAAVAASLVTAVLFQTVIKTSGVGRETLEGVTMLIAAAVLFYVSYWLISKIEARRWQRYIRTKVEGSLRSSSVFALGFAAFLAVYREGAETVLFYQALHSSASAGGGGGGAVIAAGFTLGAVLLAGLFLLIKYGSVRVPLGPFFAVTSALLYYLAFTFSGKAVLELQGAGKLSSTVIPGLPALPFLGLYPTWEGVALQGALLFALIAALFYSFVLRRERGVAGLKPRAGYNG